MGHALGWLPPEGLLWLRQTFCEWPDQAGQAAALFNMLLVVQLSDICLTSLINICGQARDAAKAEDVWSWAQQLPGQPNRTVYNSMINTQERSRQPARVVELFDKMQAAGLQADTTTYAALCDAFGQQGEWEKQRTALRVSTLSYNMWQRLLL